MSGLYNFHLGGDIQEIIDFANSKYNNEAWREYATWDNPQLTKTWNAMFDTIDVATRPAILSPIAGKPLKSVTGAEFMSDRMPMMGLAFDMNQADMQEYMELVEDSIIFSDYLKDKYFVKASSVLQGYHSQLNSWIYEIISTGKVEVTPEMKLGNPFVVDFQPLVKNKFKCLAEKWFKPDGTPNENAKPVNDLVRWVRQAKKNNVVFDHIEAPLELIEKTMLHPSVLADVRARLFPNAVGVTPVTEDDVKQTLLSVFGLPPILPIDEMSRVDANGKIVDLPPSFEKNTFALVNSGITFSVKNSPSFLHNDTNPNVTITHAEGGRISFITTQQSDPWALKTSSEAWFFPVPKNKNNICFFKVDESSNDGTWK